MGHGRSAQDDELTVADRRYRSALLAFFRRRTPDRAEAEDLTQEVFAKLAATGLRTVENPDAFIFQVAANLLRDKLRRDKVRRDWRASAEPLDGADVDRMDPARVLAAREELGATARALAALPPRTRAVFLLVRLEQMRQAEVAALYGISVSAVQKHLVRALAHLTAATGDGA